MTIVVKIRDSDTRAICLDPAHTRLGCDVHKLAIAQIVIQSVLNRFLAFAPGGFTSIQQKNIHFSVVVKIEEPDTTSHGLDEIPVRGKSVEMSPAETGFGCYVGKNGARRSVASEHLRGKELTDSGHGERGKESASRETTEYTAKTSNCFAPNL